MKYLFVHQNFPGQYLHFVRHLAASGKNEILFITENNPNMMAGVRKIVYRVPRGAAPEAHPDAREFDAAMVRAEAVARAAGSLKALGFEPDVIIGHHGWGELLNLGDVWPDAPLLGYFEFYYRLNGIDVGFDPEFPTHQALYPGIRAKNAINHLALSLGGLGQTPTQFQHSTYPDWAQKQILVLPEGADLEACRPDPSIRAKPFALGDVRVAPGEKLITYVARDLEPYRGFHVFMRALPKILAERPDARVILVGGDGVSYGARLSEGTWRERLLMELRGRLDESRVHFVGRIPHSDYLRMLQRSDSHVYLTYPFVASWSMREALASGCAVVGSDTPPVREFISHERNGVLAPFLQPDRIADGVLRLLEDRALNERVRVGARRYAERHLAMSDYLAAMEDVVRRLTRGGQAKKSGVRVA